MLSEEAKRLLGIYVKSEFGIGDLRFPMFVEKLESIMIAHPLPAETTEEPVLYIEDLFEK